MEKYSSFQLTESQTRNNQKIIFPLTSILPSMHSKNRKIIDNRNRSAHHTVTYQHHDVLNIKFNIHRENEKWKILHQRGSDPPTNTNRKLHQETLIFWISMNRIPKNNIFPLMFCSPPRTETIIEKSNIFKKSKIIFPE